MITDAPDGPDKVRSCGIVFNLVSQPRYANVDAAIERVSIAPAKQVHDRIAAQYPVGVFHKDVQQIELGPRQLDLFALLQQYSRLRVQPIRPKLRVYFINLFRYGLGLTPAQNRAYPRKQLARIERLGYVVVRSNFEPDDAIDFLTTSGNHHDRQLVIRTQAARQRQPVFAGQHQVEDDKVGAVSGKPGIHVGTVLDGGDIKSLFAEVQRQKVARFPVVIDDEEVRYARTRIWRRSVHGK